MPNYIDPNRRSHRYPVHKVQTCSGQPLEVTTTSGNVTYIQPGGTSSDAFGRLRTVNPLTLFDSSHRYNDNGLWATSSGTGGTTAFSTSGGLVDLNVTTTSGSQIVRETTKCFSYQPGKSLWTSVELPLANSKLFSKVLIPLVMPCVRRARSFSASLALLVVIMPPSPVAICLTG